VSGRQILPGCRPYRARIVLFATQRFRTGLPYAAPMALVRGYAAVLVYFMSLDGIPLALVARMGHPAYGMFGAALARRS
jgi:hypothetical protein